MPRKFLPALLLILTVAGCATLSPQIVKETVVVKETVIVRETVIVTQPPLPTDTPKPAALVCDCSGDRYNCSSFSTHAAAQACYNYCDGSARETLP